MLPSSQRVGIRESYERPTVAWTTSVRTQHDAIDGQRTRSLPVGVLRRNCGVRTSGVTLRADHEHLDIKLPHVCCYHALGLHNRSKNMAALSDNISPVACWCFGTVAFLMLPGLKQIQNRLGSQEPTDHAYQDEDGVAMNESKLAPHGRGFDSYIVTGGIVGTSTAIFTAKTSADWLYAGAWVRLLLNLVLFTKLILSSGFACCSSHSNFARAQYTLEVSARYQWCDLGRYHVSQHALFRYLLAT